MLLEHALKVRGILGVHERARSWQVKIVERDTQKRSAAARSISGQAACSPAVNGRTR